MPNVTVYIRRADLDKFKALPNKAEFISNALNRDLQKVHDDWDKLEDAGLYKPARAAVQPKWIAQGKTLTGDPNMASNPHIIKTKEDAVETIKQLFPEAEFIEPLYRDKKKKKL